MAAGTIITVLSNVPWGQVIDAAPKVAEGATKLWGAVTGRKKADADRAPAGSVDVYSDPGNDSLPQLRADVRALQRSVTELREELLAATSLIKQLVEQNTVLVQRVESHRRRLAQVSAVAGLLVVAMLAAASYVWFLR